jgi:hypothetical protein
MQHPSYRLIQLASKSLGVDAGPVDGWWGKRTRAAAHHLSMNGPQKSSIWAINTLNRGLEGLGYLPHGVTDNFDGDTYAALRALVDADGLPFASVSASTEVLTPTKPALLPDRHAEVMRQGGAGTVIDAFMIHCAAVPGDWHRYKTNAEIVADIHRMHTDPVSRGGRGWSDTGYHSICTPDGERFDARPEDRYGAGAVGYNRGVYHHLMIEVGTITSTKRAEDYFTPQTLAATKDHIESIAQRTQLRRLMGHREVAAKLCPGFEVIDREWTDRAVS